MIITTGNDVAGRQITRYLGIVCGIVMRERSITRGLELMVGGNIEKLEALADVCEEARREAYQRMREHAKKKGADAVIGMRYDATEFAEGVTEVLAYGTAVELEQAGDEAS